MDVVKYEGKDYSTVISYESWRVGLIRWAERFEKVDFFERHNKTDEVFVLLCGEAVLYVADEALNVTQHKMERGVLYNVRRAEWHALTMSHDALVMVVENADTSTENSDYVNPDGSPRK
ncbi:MAG: hypothetical protein GX057_02745 [Clostridiales bacterium]|jgi:hypothetical protein|nr:hypothetical protein [Clostridiales bacterium]